MLLTITKINAKNLFMDKNFPKKSKILFAYCFSRNWSSQNIQIQLWKILNDKFIFFYWNDTYVIQYQKLAKVQINFYILVKKRAFFQVHFKADAKFDIFEVSYAKI